MKSYRSKKTSFLTQAVLASTVFCLISADIFAFQDLGPAQNNSDSGVWPDSAAGGGYNFNANNITFTILNNYNIGIGTGTPLVYNFSVDNNQSKIFNPFSNDTLIFQGNSIVPSAVGFVNNISTINLQGGAGTIVQLQNGVDVDSGNLNFAPVVIGAPYVQGPGATPTTTLILSSTIPFSGGIDNTTGIPGIGTLVFPQAGAVGNNVFNASIRGNVGASNPLNLIQLNTLGGANTISFQGLFLQADTITVVGAGGTTLLLKSNTGGMTVTGNITTNNNNIDTINVNNVGPTVITGNIGAVGNNFLLVEVGANGDTTMNGNLVATTTQFQANNTFNLGNTFQITGLVDSTAANQGKLTFLGSGTVTGNIGATNALSTINIKGAGANVNLDGTIIKANNTNFAGSASATSSLNLVNNVVVTGNIDNLVAPNVGNVNFAGNGTVTGTIGATNPLNSVNAQGAGAIINFNSTFNAHNVNFEASANNATTLNFAAATSITGNLDNITGTAGVGIVNFATNATVGGTVGATDPLNTINIKGANSTINLNGNVNHVNNIIFAGAANSATTLNVGDNADFNTIDNIVGPNIGNVNFNGNGHVVNLIGATNALNTVTIHGPTGTVVTIDNGAKVASMSVDFGGELLISDSQTITGNLSLTNTNSTLALANNADLTINGNFSMGPGTILQVDMGSNATTTGHVTTSGVASDSPNASVKIINPTLSVPQGKLVIPLIISNGGGGGLNAIPVTSSSLLTRFSTEVDGNILNLIATISPLSPFVNQSNNGGVSDALDSIIESGLTTSGTLAAIIAELGAFTDAAALEEALAELAPNVDGDVLYGSFDMQHISFNTILERITDVRGGIHYPCRRINSGFNGGDGNCIDKGGWVKLFGQHASQKDREGIQGYDDTVLGIAVGTDVLLSQNALIGGAFNWAHMRADGNAPGVQTKADSYQLSLYGNVGFSEPWYIEWIGGVAYNDYHTERDIIFSSLFLQPTGDFHGLQTGAKLDMGYVLLWGEDAFHPIPLISLFYSHLDVASYKEKDAGTVNQAIDGGDFDLLQGGAGIKFVYDYIYDKTVFQPEFHLMGFYNFINDHMETTSEFTGGGPSFLTVGFKPPRDSYNVGASITAFSSTHYVVAASYDFNFKARYTAHAGLLRFRYEW